MGKLTSPDMMKRQNTKSVLKIIHHEERIYRKRIAEMTRLSTQTVTNIVKDLMEKGIVKEESIKKKAAGRNPMALTINYEGFYVIGVEVTTDALAAVLTDLRGEVIARESHICTSDKDALSLLKEMLNRLLQQVEDSNHLKAIGFSVEGVVNDQTGMITQSSSLAWKGVDLKKELEYLGVPILLSNDVNVLADKENFRVDREENFIVVKLDQGIGSSFVIEGHVMRNGNSVAGEFGHITVQIGDDALSCRCGKQGCLTTIASIGALEKEFQMSYEEIKEKVEQGDTVILERLLDICHKIALPLANLITLLDLDRVILTGRLIIDQQNIMYNKLDELIRKNLSDWLSYRGLRIMVMEDVAKTCAKILVEDCLENEKDFLF